MLNDHFYSFAIVIIVVSWSVWRIVCLSAVLLSDHRQTDLTRDLYYSANKIAPSSFT